MTVKPLADRRRAEVLLVEDNQDDVFFTREAFDLLPVNLHHVDNGVKCMQFLRKQSVYQDVPSPDLILLDMHMPLMNGHDVLKAMVADENLCHIPVVVLTTSHEAEDILKMYKLRCNAYITKPVSFENFTKAIAQLSDHWFKLTILPSAG